MLGRWERHAYHLKRLQKLLDLAQQIDTTLPRPNKPLAKRVSLRLTPVQQRQLADEYEGGIATTRLMTKYGIGKGTVLRILESQGVTMRRQPLTAEQVSTAIELYVAGQSLQAVAVTLGCDHETVRRALLGAGLALRRPWQRGTSSEVVEP